MVPGNLQATYTDPHYFRLIQSPLSTHLLVGVLGVLLLFAITILISVDMRHVLPKPMGSIASVASLLAGSRFVDPKSFLIPKGSEFWSDSDWEKSGVWKGEVFRMGWWDKYQQPVEFDLLSKKGKRDSEIVMGTTGGDLAFDPSDGDSIRSGKESVSGDESFRIDACPVYVLR